MTVCAKNALKTAMKTLMGAATHAAKTLMNANLLVSVHLDGITIISILMDDKNCGKRKSKVNIWNWGYYDDTCPAQ